MPSPGSASRQRAIPSTPICDAGCGWPGSTRCGVQISRTIRLQSGCVYLVAVIDWFSRYVLSWAVSITMDVPLCVQALDDALSQGQPEIFNTDQGAQFTSQAFTARLQKGGVRMSMDGRGRALDHVCVERLWRTVKYEEVYVRDYESVQDARQGLGRYFVFYNEARLHQALGYLTPAAVYRGWERCLSLVRAKVFN